MNDKQTILRIDSSPRKTGSTTRALNSKLVEQLQQHHDVAEVIDRDVSKGISFCSADWVEATFTPADNRTDLHKEVLRESDTLVAELQKADIVIIGVPVYNFGVPASLKAWIDMIARLGVTFKHTENGPVGLLSNKKAYVVYAAGGTKLGSDIDFASGYMKHVLGFVGIMNMEIISSEDEIAALAQKHTKAA